MKIYHLEQLLAIQDLRFLIQKIEDGFLANSKNKVNMPPVCHMQYSNISSCTKYAHLGIIRLDRHLGTNK